MRFLIDTQLPPRLADFLTDRGHDSIHTTFFPAGHLLTDPEIVIIANRENRSIITKDSDFLDHYHLKGAPPKVLLLSFGNISNQELLTYFSKHLPAIVAHFTEGAELIDFGRSGLIVS